MSSRTPRTPVYETHPAIHPNTLPPPPPRNAIGSAPLSREHVGQLPALSVISIPQTTSHHSTPLSAVSHHSPFTPLHSAPSGQVPGSLSRGTSPMAARGSAQFSVPYDPRDWAGGDLRANQALRARQQQAEDGLASPPPPYSPQNVDQDNVERAGSRPVLASGSPITNHSISQQSATLSSQAHHRTAQHPQLRSRGHHHPNHRHSLHMNYTVPPPSSSSNAQAIHHPNSSGSFAGEPSSYFPRDASPGPSTYAPAARRAVSANAGLGQRTDEGSSSRSPSQSRWQPGMPLPGPPPLPPPPVNARSQSMNNARERSGSSGPLRPHQLRHTLHSSSLDPVPPTPAGWNERLPMPQNSQEPLQIDTTAQIQLVTSHQAEGLGSTAGTPVQTPGSTLVRSSALRDASAKGLRERRAQNRNSRILNDQAHLALDVHSNNTDTTCTESGSTQIHASPASPNRVISGKPKSFMPLAGVFANSAVVTESPLDLSTPPFSPPPQCDPRDTGSRLTTGPTKSLPTPPLSQKAPLSARSIANSSRGSFSTPTGEVTDGFVKDATLRHAQFLERERLARTDHERLEAFADFTLQESNIRQKLYEAALKSGEFDVQAFRERLFAPPTQRNSLSISTQQPSVEAQSHAADPSAVSARTDSAYWKDYQPALSPIASMGYDEMSSRGRAPSRWWESQTGSQGGGRNGQVQRSKRESKYMGLSKDVLFAHSPNEDFPTPDQNTYFPRDKTYPQEKANPETFGYYDEYKSHVTPTFQPQNPATPRLLDISRFITLPPPYPRHYPAVNNSHPDLTKYRTTVRALSDLSDIQTRRSRHQLSLEALRSDLKRKIYDGRRTFQAGVQAQIQEGSITYAEAAEAEEANRLNEFELEKKSLQAEFDTLQDVVINPLHDMLSERIVKLDVTLQGLQEDLRNDARQQNPDRPQEEGDETPELLEKLSQLKWLFDTREQIHKECFDVLSDRNDKYKSIVLFPYKWSSNNDKIRDTETFFERDTQTRYTTFCENSLKRHQEFLDVVDQHVSRGVELQSSAFWDIAPGLLDLLQKIPNDPQKVPAFEIPTKEYEENPSYRQHPQQYLYTLLSHAEKSTYQYIESQINLHCLLHEVKSGVVAARYRLLEARETTNGTHCDDITASRGKDEMMLTGELKQKASMIEEQWLEALGSQLQGTREGIKAFLQQTEAWDEIAEDEV